jgi:hypothetical protein
MEIDTDIDIGIGVGNAAIEEKIISNGTKRRVRMEFNSAPR